MQFTYWTLIVNVIVIIKGVALYNESSGLCRIFCHLYFFFLIDQMSIKIFLKQYFSFLSFVWKVQRAWEKIWKDLKPKKEEETNNDNRNVSLTIEDYSDDEQHESEPKQNDKSKATGGNTHNKQVKEKDVYSSPTMVFSVIGDSSNFVPRPWPKTVFQTALIEAAKSGGGMVI